MLYGVDRALQSPTEDEETEDGRSESDSEPGNSSKSRPAHNHSSKPGQAGEQSQERASESDASPSDPDAASDASDVCEEEEFVRRARTPFQRKYRKLYWMRNRERLQLAVVSAAGYQCTDGGAMLMIEESHEYSKDCGNDG